MSSGLPVVAVAAGGLVDIMKDCEGTTGAFRVGAAPRAVRAYGSGQVFGQAALRRHLHRRWIIADRHRPKRSARLRSAYDV